MQYVLIFLSLLVTAFGQPAWFSSLGLISAAFGYALFWKGMLCFPRQRDQFILSIIWFSCVQGIQLSWMVTLDYMGPLIIILYLFLVLAMGVQFAILSSMIRSKLHGISILAISSMWVVFEWMRLFFLCGFTWNQVGLALANSHYSLQFASIGGILALSFWVIFVNLHGLRAWVAPSRKKWVHFACFACFPYFFGFVHQLSVESIKKDAKHLKVALLQTGLYPEQKDLLLDAPNSYIEPIEQWKRIINIIDSSRSVDLVVFPEAALPLGAHVAGYNFEEVKNLFPIAVLPPLKRPYAIFDRGHWKVTNAFIAQAFANWLKAEVIIGLDDQDFLGRYNAAFHFKPKKQNYARYEKQVLVPVGEYVPATGIAWVSKFISEQFGIYSSFDQGTESKIFHSQIPIGVSICLEETFSHLIRGFRLKGAEFFVNITNDVWFPRSKLPLQHFHHGRVRCVENGVSTVRSCNTGITGAIDCFGRVIETLPPSESGASALYLDVPTLSYRTLYTLWGDGGILSFSFLSLAAYFLFLKKKLP